MKEIEETNSIEELIKQLDEGDYSQFENGEYFEGNGFKTSLESKIFSKNRIFMYNIVSSEQTAPPR